MNYTEQKVAGRMDFSKLKEIRAADSMVKCLEAEGVEFIFGVPGEENLDFLDALRSSSIKLIVTRHEQAAAFMAACLGRITGKTGVCFSTLGPGATNLVTGAAYAQLASFPMLMITGQKPIHKSKQGHFQIIDAVAMLHPVTKFAKVIVAPSRVPATMREAFRRAEEERQGAVHLELPEDVAADLIHERVEAEPFPRDRIRRPVAEDKAICQAISMIQAAKSPLLLVGAAANRKMTSNMLTEFVKNTGIYFFNTQMGKGVIDERSDRYIGTAALSARDYVHLATEKADLIINVGHDVVEKPPFFQKHDSQKVIHVNFYGAEVDEVYFPQLEVIGDIANAIWRIKEGIAVQDHWDFSHFENVRLRFEEDRNKKIDDPRFPLQPERVVADIRRVMPDDGIVSLDNGLYKIVFARSYKAHERNTLLLDNALATMGAGLPCGIAAKLQFPERKVVAVAGDGGFMMNSQELATAVAMNTSIVQIVLNDSCYGMIRWKQDSSGFGNYGLQLANPDFVKYAEAYGAKGHRVTQADEFKPLLAKCLSEGGVHLIDVPITYDESGKHLNCPVATSSM
eukprot:Rmarinus@m.7654